MLKWNEIIVVSCYISPNTNIRQFNVFLDELKIAMHNYIEVPLIIMGDFNAHHSDWDNNIKDTRDRLLKNWIDNLGLFVLNIDKVATCVRPQGCFVVDLCLGNTLAQNRIYRLKVRVDLELLSDHKIICVDFTAKEAINRFRHVDSRFPRWNCKKLDLEMLGAAANFGAWVADNCIDNSTSDMVNWINDTLNMTSDMVMPKSKGLFRTSVY